jgi:hypothetical protein
LQWINPKLIGKLFTCCEAIRVARGQAPTQNGRASAGCGRGGYQGYHQPKYALHDLRHFYASWCINRRQDGGLELPMKMVQERLRQSTKLALVSEPRRWRGDQAGGNSSSPDCNMDAEGK